jgi:flavin-dependent dehydrogenase
VLTGANQVHLNSDGRGAISGAAVGGESFEAPTTILTEAIGAKGAGSMRLEETFAISPKALENRFQVRDGQGSSIECLLGFLPAPWTGMGWVIPHRAHLTLGVTLHRPPGSEEGTGLESAYERFRGHPGIAGYTSGCERIDRRSYLAPIAPTRRRLAVPGLLLAGPAAGLGDPIGIVAPGLAPSLASARAAGEAVGPGAASSSKTSTAGSVYLARLRAWGILEQIDHARAHPIPLGWDGNARRRNSQILVRTFHELLTETGAPKEPITRTLRRVRRASGASYTSLAWDALTLGRNL